MTAIKAIEILNKMYDKQLEKEKVCSEVIDIAIKRIDEINDRKIALLTAIDALKEKCDIIK